MIIGTAGHIDHGKTSLVRALTGVDTDRLAEERARGISIELGYAYVPRLNGDTLGFVDVPGHEKFVPTMLAGATGIDFVLLVVAADDGVMPQTREHLAILSLLGVDRGAIAITKIDMAEPARVRACRREIEALTAPTPLAASPIFEISSRSGEGIEALRAHLYRCGEETRTNVDNGHFRLAVDRSFTLAGAGTVVTGTVHSGTVRVGDRLTIAPSGREARVRSIHAQDRASDTAITGQRCALALPGTARDEVRRGDWIVAPEIALGTVRFDARLQLLAQEEAPVRSGTLLHVHLGTAHVTARIAVLSGDDGPTDVVMPGESALVQFVLQDCISAWRGDRIIVRDTSVRRTLGGGFVVDPFAPARYRKTPERIAVLQALEQPTVSTQLEKLVACSPLGVDLDAFARAGNICDPAATLTSLQIRRIDTTASHHIVSEESWSALQSQLEHALDRFHVDQPDLLGPDRARLKRIALPRVEGPIYDALVESLVARGRVLQRGPWLHRPDHDDALTSQEHAWVERVLPDLLNKPYDPPWLRDLSRARNVPERPLRQAMIRAAKSGEVYQVVHDLFYHPDAIRDLASLARQVQDEDGSVRAAVFRDRTGLGRKRAIQVLEFFDRVGLTRRVRDAHIVRSESILGLEGAVADARVKP
jgi:selenocysteine-specific elongation factor